jgi:hypothetical protein
VNAHRCCVLAANDAKCEQAEVRITERDPHPPSFTRRSFHFAAKTIPAAILVLLPKCPACLAAYLALGTGIGISLTAAAYIRWLLVMVCVTSLVYFAAKSTRRGWLHLLRSRSLR